MTVFLASLCYMNKALVSSINEGQMNRKAISFNCFMYFSISIIEIISTFYNNKFDTMFLVLTIVDYILFYCVAAVTFWITISFESSFELKTQTIENGCSQIYGVNKKGIEIFRFNLGNKVECEKSDKLSKSLSNTQKVINQSCAKLLTESARSKHEYASLNSSQRDRSNSSASKTLGQFIKEDKEMSDPDSIEEISQSSDEESQQSLDVSDNEEGGLFVEGYQTQKQPKDTPNSKNKIVLSKSIVVETIEGSLTLSAKELMNVNHSL